LIDRLAWGLDVEASAMAAVHLSFDNGPHPEGTPRVLDVLAAHALPATFFVLGRELDRPAGYELARRVQAAGHRLGNHSWSHGTPLGDDPRPDAVELELERTQRLLDGLDVGAPCFRPFGGGGKLGPHLLSPAAVDWMVRRKATCVLWNVVPGDWTDPDGWVDRALTDLETREHALVVLHDAVPAATKHLDAFVRAAKGRGHTFTDAWPDDCVPLRAGQPRPGLERYVAATAP
jgi:peptidoglycan/xylan/chitin deacetylase (PgdA/CDA1 family)